MAEFFNILSPDTTSFRLVVKNICLTNLHTTGYKPAGVRDSRGNGGCKAVKQSGVLDIKTHCTF